MAFPWAPLIAGATKLGSGLLGMLGGGGLSPRKSAQLQHQYFEKSLVSQNQNMKPYYQSLVKAAEASGFNPLTLVRGGGGAGFQQTHAPVLSSNEYSGTLGGALASGLEAGVQAAFDYDPLAEEKSQIELDIMKGQLRRISGGDNRYTRLGGAPSATGSRFQTTVAGTPVSKSTLAKGPSPMQGDREVTNPYPDGSGIQVNPGFINAEAFEDRYGDNIFVSTAATAANALADTFWNNRERINRAVDWYNRYIPTDRQLIDGAKTFWGKAQKRHDSGTQNNFWSGQGQPFLYE